MLNIEFPYDSAILLLSTYPEEMTTYVYMKTLYTNVCSSIIHNSRKMETIQMFVSWRMGKRNVV